jgi:hypothetical protein
MSKTFTHAEPNEFPADVQPLGTYPATWTQYYLRLADGTRFPVSIAMPGTVECSVTITAELVTVTITLAAWS